MKHHNTLLLTYGPHYIEASETSPRIVLRSPEAVLELPERLHRHAAANKDIEHVSCIIEETADMSAATYRGITTALRGVLDDINNAGIAVSLYIVGDLSLRPNQVIHRKVEKGTVNGPVMNIAGEGRIAGLAKLAKKFGTVKIYFNEFCRYNGNTLPVRIPYDAVHHGISINMIHDQFKVESVEMRTSPCVCHYMLRTKVGDFAITLATALKLTDTEALETCRLLTAEKECMRAYYPNFTNAVNSGDVNKIKKAIANILPLGVAIVEESTAETTETIPAV